MKSRDIHPSVQAMSNRLPNDRPIRITYTGRLDDGFEAFRIHLDGLPGMASLMIETEISYWLHDNARKEWRKGRGFPGLVNPNEADCFVLFESLIDLFEFSKHYPIEGYSPLSLMGRSVIPA